MSLTAIILAAGKSTRMKSRRAKPLHEICGRPMLHYIAQACFAAGCDRLLVVVGYGKDEIVSQFGGHERISFVEQTEQLGTGHAARVCEPQLRGTHGDVFILAGDVPLTRAEALRTLLRAHREEHAAASMATAILDDPTGYGRVVRDGKGEFVKIVEQLDGTPEQREIREVFPSYYCCRAEDLLFALARLKNENKKSEYYLTDIFEILKVAGKKVVAVQAVTAEDVIAPNTREQLAQADCLMQERIQRQLYEAGVTIVSPQNTYVESGATIGADTVLEPFTFIGRDASIGRDCTIGPHAVVPRESILPDGSVIAGNVTVENAMLERSGS